MDALHNQEPGCDRMRVSTLHEYLEAVEAYAADLVVGRELAHL